ncbi:MAG TPA: AsmA family protein [Usitatibacter sp.]|nr:AsmA family protein [Usitatibacter sp.]
MMKWSKAALGLAGVVVLAGVAGALALRTLVDPVHLAKEAHERARSALGRDLTLGAVRLDLFPRPTLVAQDLVLANPPWAAQRELLHARRVVAKLALWPLVLGRTRVKALVLEGARANLEVRSDGAKSWEIHQARASGKPASPDDAAWSDLEAVELSHARVEYRGYDGALDAWSVERASARLHEGLRDVRIEASLARNGHPLRVKGRFADLSHLGEPGATSQGSLELDWGKTRFTANGSIPLDHDMEQATFDATLHSDSLQDVLAFLGRQERHTARIDARASVTRSRSEVSVRNLAVTLGNQKLAGEWTFDLGKKPSHFSARLASDDFDWGRALVDAGYPKPPPNPPGEMFPVRPLPWGMLAAMDGKRGEMSLAFGRLVLPDGIELRDASGHVTIDGDHLRLDPFAAQALGGRVKGTLQLEAGGKAAQVELAGEGVELERWFRERHRPVHFRGGPMKIVASIHTQGDSLKDMAGAMSGPVSILMSRGVWDSKVAGDWEARMVDFAKDQDAIDFECVGAAMPFESGRAKASDFIGARSRESRLLLSGTVDLRKEQVDLKGRVRPRPDAGVGLSTIADDIEIHGPLHHMTARLDPKSKPKVIAKGALAVVTAGISAVASAASSSAQPDPDPCEQVFSKGHPKHP